MSARYWENLHREDLSPVEEACGIVDWVDACLGEEEVYRDGGSTAVAKVRKLLGAACGDGVSLSLSSDDDPDERNPDIFITGVECMLPVEGMTGRTLNDALRRLALSAECLEAYFAGEDDYDHWEQEGGSPGEGN